MKKTVSIILGCLLLAGCNVNVQQLDPAQFRLQNQCREEASITRDGMAGEKYFEACVMNDGARGAAYAELLKSVDPYALCLNTHIPAVTTEVARRRVNCEAERRAVAQQAVSVMPVDELCVAWYERQLGPGPRPYTLDDVDFEVQRRNLDCTGVVQHGQELYMRQRWMDQRRVPHGYERHDEPRHERRGPDCKTTKSGIFTKTVCR